MGPIVEAVKASVDLEIDDETWRFMIRDYDTYAAVRDSYFYTDVELKNLTYENIAAHAWYYNESKLLNACSSEI